MSQLQQSLLIYGQDALGGRIGQLWKKKHQTSKVVAVARPKQDGSVLQDSDGVSVQTSDQLSGSFSNVIFSILPSKFTDITPKIQHAIDCWDQKGQLILTSSTAVYDASDVITETSQTYKRSEEGINKKTLNAKSKRMDNLIKGEDLILQAGGIVIRYGGLYHLTRGFHQFYLERGNIYKNGQEIMNLIHYEDGAQLALKALESDFRQEIFNGVDEEPLPLEDCMRSFVESAYFQDNKDEITFEFGQEPVVQQRYVNGDKAKNFLNLVHKFPSFKKFMKEQIHEDPFQ